MKKRRVSRRSTENERDRRETDTRLKKFVGLLRRPICRSNGNLMLAVTVEYHDHDPRSLHQKDDVHPEAQRDTGERVESRGCCQGLFVRACWVSAGLLRSNDGGNESEERRSSTQARHGYKD